MAIQKVALEFQAQTTQVARQWRCDGPVIAGLVAHGCQRGFAQQGFAQATQTLPIFHELALCCACKVLGEHHRAAAIPQGFEDSGQLPLGRAWGHPSA